MSSLKSNGNLPIPSLVSNNQRHNIAVQKPMALRYIFLQAWEVRSSWRFSWGSCCRKAWQVTETSGTDSSLHGPSPQTWTQAWSRKLSLFKKQFFSCHVTEGKWIWLHKCCGCRARPSQVQIHALLCAKWVHMDRPFCWGSAWALSNGAAKATLLAYTN